MIPGTHLSIVVIVFWACLGGVIVYIVGFMLPPRIVGTTPNAQAVERRKLENDVRGTLLQGLGGILFLATAYLSFAQLRETINHNSEELDHNRKVLAIESDKQIADRFAQAVEEPGNQDNLDVRLGGIYALRRIGETSGEYRRPLIELYTAFVRGHSPWPAPPPATKKSERTVAQLRAEDRSLPLRTRAPDVQAVMRILGSVAPAARDGATLDLQGVNLYRVFLFRAQFQKALLMKSNLAGADFTEAHLESGSLISTNLAGAHLVGAKLQGANLSGADIRGADISGAKFDQKTNLKGAQANGNTKWPAGFSDEDAKKAGVRFGP